MNKSTEVLVEALEQALRPLESSIIKEYCDIYNVEESEIKLRSLYNLVGMSLSILEENGKVYEIL